MSHSNHSGRIARQMIEINPYMRGPVELMSESSRIRWQDVIIYAAEVAAVVAMAVLSVMEWLPGAGK